MFKIGEFSKLTQVSIRMLRYYDEVCLLKPAKVDKFTGYRMYSPEQISTLQKIILLRDARFTTKEIKNTIDKYNNLNIINELEKKKIQIEEEIELEKERIIKIDSTIKALEKNSFEIHCNINFKKVDKILILSLRDKVASHFHEGILWERLFDFINEEEIYLNKNMYNNIALYHDLEHKDENVDVEVGVVVNKKGENKNGFIYREVDTVEKMAYAMVYGPYSNLAKAYEKLAFWIEKEKEEMAYEASRQICHIGVDDIDDPNKYLTEIQIPLK